MLVDSRTGVSDSAGICTVQLPDDLVARYMLNTQSIEGASAVAANVFEKRRRRPDLPAAEDISRRHEGGKGRVQQT